ncbi:MAG: hypothetical protein JO064_10140 [Actinobacteria bacterium]|nr:hypothetical protein [Actinomycetota bacterium]
MARGPLVVRFGDWTLDEPQAGAVIRGEVELENAGTVPWRKGIRLAYHWLDERDNPIVWDGDRTEIPPLAPGDRMVVTARVRAPIPPGRYRFAFDLVAEHRAWFSELGGELRTRPMEVHPRSTPHHADLPPWVEPAPGWHERVADAHAEGFGVVAGAIAWDGGVLHPRPRPLAPYEPGPGRVPGFSYPLVCPSVVEGVTLERLPDVEGLPAFLPPPDWEPWIYDGRIVLTADPRKR